MHQVISTELSTNVWWFLWFIWCFIKTNHTPPQINTDPKALAMDWRPLPSSVTRTKGLWDCWPSVLAWAPVVGCCHGDEAVWCSLQQTPTITAPVDHNNTPWPAFLASILPSFEHQNSTLPFPSPLLSFAFLPTSSSFPPSGPVLYLTFSPSQMSRHRNRERRIFIRLKHHRDVTTLVMLSVRHLTLPLIPPRALPPVLWTAVCSFTPLQRSYKVW